MADWDSWGAVPPPRPAHAPSEGWDDDAPPPPAPSYGAPSSDQPQLHQPASLPPLVRPQDPSPYHSHPPPSQESVIHQSPSLPSSQNGFTSNIVNDNNPTTSNVPAAIAGITSPPPSSNVATTAFAPPSGMGLWKPITPSSRSSAPSVTSNHQHRQFQPSSTLNNDRNDMNNSNNTSSVANHVGGTVFANGTGQGQSTGNLLNQSNNAPIPSNGGWISSQIQTQPISPQSPMNSGNGNIPLSASAHAPSATPNTPFQNNVNNNSYNKVNDGGWITSAAATTGTTSMSSPSYGGMNASSFGQEKRPPPVYIFSVPPEARAYLIGTGGANLTRIQDETPGIRITRGKPKTESDPYDRDFLVYNDNHLPQELLDIVLMKICRIVRRKINDWLPYSPSSEGDNGDGGKVAQDAKRLLEEGKLDDIGGGSPQAQQNGRGNEYAHGTVQTGSGGSDHFCAGNGYREASSSPVDTFPTQPGPFKDPTSPMQIPSNWGGLPRPTFSPGPRSTVSRTSTGHPAPIPSTQANEIRSNDAVGGWKPNAPSFIPSAQATQATSASPAVLAASSAPLASNFGWNTTGATTSSVAMPESTGIVFTSNGPSPQSVSNNAPERVPAPAVSVTGTTPAANGQTATNPSPVSGWTDMKTASNDGHGPIQAVSSSNERSQASIQQTEPQMTSNPAAFGWNVKQPTSNTGIAPQFQGQVPQREETPRPAAQQPSSFQNATASHASHDRQLAAAAPSAASPHERKTTHDSGWDENSSKQAQSAPCASAQEFGWGAALPSAAPSTHGNNVASLGANMANMRLDDDNTGQYAQGAPSSGQSNGYTSMSAMPSNIGHQASPPVQASNSGWKPRAFNGVPDSPTFSPAAQVPQRLQSEVSAPLQQTSVDLPKDSAIPVSSGGGIGWDDEPAPPAAAAAPKDTATVWGAPAPRAQNNAPNGYTSNQSSFDDAAETVRPSDSISNVNVDSRSTVNGAGYGQQYTAPPQMNGRQSDSGWGQRTNAANGAGSGNATYGQNSYGSMNGHQAHNGGGAGNYGGSHNNNYASNGTGYSSQGRENGYSSGEGGGGGYSSGYGNNPTNGFSNNTGGYGSGGGGNNYGGGYGGPPQERRFPGPGGSWASGANDVPLQQNRWITQAGRRPGDDVRRPVVPQAIPGSGW